MTKHIDIQYYYIRENVLNDIVSLIYLPTKVQPADGLIKALDTVKFQHFVKSLGLRKV